MGHFIVYLNGLPMIVDAVAGVYTRKTFSDTRYEVWTMQSAYHNLPTTNCFQQKDGAQYRARNWKTSVTDEAAVLPWILPGLTRRKLR
ncbi:hypothetical protein KAH55_03075 [bacterium]|nr:hypothetical protein [bacterium]